MPFHISILLHLYGCLYMYLCKILTYDHYTDYHLQNK